MVSRSTSSVFGRFGGDGGGGFGDGGSGGPGDRRRLVRVERRLPVRLVRSTDDGLALRVVTGETVNVSADGVYVRTSMGLGSRAPVGELVEIVLDLSPTELPTDRRKRRRRRGEAEPLPSLLQGSARILRIDRLVSAERVVTGVALALERPFRFA